MMPVIMRIRLSVPPPGAYGTTTSTGRCGYFACANAAPDDDASTAAANSVFSIAILLGDGAMVASQKIPPTSSSQAMDELLYEVRDGVGYVTFNRPQARNALTFAMYERLAEICNDPHGVRAILVTGAGDKAFAAGTDISQFRTFDKEEDALQY